MPFTKKARFAAGLSTIILLITGITAWLMLTHGLEIGRWAKRRSFAALGLERQTIASPVGGQVVFESSNVGAPDLVLIHGFGDDASTWSIPTKELVGRYHLIVPDLAGHGGSGPTGDELSYEDVYQALAKVLGERTNGRGVVVVGNSLGGWLAMRYALEHPNQVNHLVLINAAGLEHPIDKSLLIPTSRDALSEKLRLMFPDGTLPELPGFAQDQLIGMTDLPRLNALFDSLEQAGGLDDRLPGIRVPTDVVWGTPDGFFPMSYALRLEAAIPDSAFHELPGCGHAPQIACGPRLTDLLLDIFEDRATETAS